MDDDHWAEGLLMRSVPVTTVLDGLDCSQRAHHRFHIGTPGAPTTAAQMVGTLAHELIIASVQGDAPRPAEELAKPWLESHVVWDRITPDMRTGIQQAREMAATVWTDGAAASPNIPPLNRGRPEVELQGEGMHGRCDWFLEGTAMAVFVDIKTGAASRAEAASASAFVQICAYAKIYATLHPNDSRQHYSCVVHAPRTAPGKRQPAARVWKMLITDRMYMVDQLHRLAADIADPDGGNVKPNPASLGCAGCPVREAQACPAYAKNLIN